MKKEKKSDEEIFNIFSCPNVDFYRIEIDEKAERIVRRIGINFDRTNPSSGDQYQIE